MSEQHEKQILTRKLEFEQNQPFPSCISFTFISKFYCKLRSEDARENILLNKNEYAMLSASPK